MEMTVHGTPLEITKEWTGKELSDWLIKDVFPDAYAYVHKAGKKAHPYLQPDEFIPVLLRHGAVKLVQPPRPMGGAFVFDHLLIRTNKPSSRLAFRMSTSIPSLSIQDD